MNPALPGGASGGEDLPDGWSVGARAGYTFVPYGRLQQGTETAPNPDQLAVDVHLGTLQVLAAAPTGTTLDLQLPFGSLATSTVAEARTDSGVGDLELRVRQSLTRWVRSPALGIAAGLVVPTGPYVARAGAANLAPEASYLTLGRGVAWWLVEGDVRVPLGERTAALAQLSARGPVMRASDGFDWGSEIRGTVGARRAIVRRIAGLASADLQWRGGASEPDPFGDGRLESANAGGWQATASLAAIVDVVAGLAVTAGVRVPVYADVAGNQLVAQTGGFVAVAYSRQLVRPSRPRIAPELGTITVVDYWASWCAPCVEIERALAAAAPGWPDVKIVRVDATGWPDDGTQLPGRATGLPVIELHDGRGNTRILVGDDALRVVEEIEALRRARPR